MIWTFFLKVGWNHQAVGGGARKFDDAKFVLLWLAKGERYVL